MATKKGIPLQSIDGFPVEASQKLAELWITTAEELVSAAGLEGGIEGLSTALEISEAEVKQLVDTAMAVLPPESTVERGLIQPHGLGALVEEEPEEEDRDIAGIGPLPVKVDLHAHLPGVRNQGQRGTCVSFSCTAVREFLLGSTSTQGDFSEQFLYWACKEHDGYNGSGTYISVGMERLLNDGIPPEAVWPYNRVPVAGNEGQGPPPADAVTQATANRILTFQRLNAKSVDALRQALSDQKMVSFAVPVYTHWFAEPTHTTGDIRLPLPGEKLEGGHAMCMVGYEVDADVPGGGYFLVRNSWGTGWGGQNPTAPGHARIPFAYINQYGSSAYTAEVAHEKPDDPIPDQQISWWERFLKWLRSLFS